MLYLCRVKPLRHYLRGFLIAAWAGDKIAEFSFPEISFHFSLRPWFFFVSPAYAGKSPAAAYACPGTQDHPRVCGEKLYTPCVIAPSVGSPPRMREKARQQEHLAAQSGITPACAGKSIIEATSRALNEDHPRMCGEKGPEEMARYLMGGSPPHVRGKGSTNGGSSWSQRITPACAGKRVEFYAERHKDQDHPRMCGEKLASGLSLRRMTGSPPHVRGKASHRGLVWELPGITPACAGKRQSPSGSHRLSLDHPRMCGEKCLNSLMVAPVTGSPPHVRGKGDSEVISQCTHGITPAYAGKSDSIETRRF